MSNRMAGKVALVTGAASGLGAAQARLFAKEGAKVVVADLNVEMGNKVVAEIQESGGEALSCGWISPMLRAGRGRSEEHTSELQSLMRISYAVFCLKKKNTHKHTIIHKYKKQQFTLNPKTH